MKKLLLKLFPTIILVLIGVSSTFAEETPFKITMTTNAPAETRLRIAPNIEVWQDMVVTGADKGTYYSDCYSKGPGTEIILTGKGLTQLEVYGCQLTSFKIEVASELYILKCYDNAIENLDVSSCVKLEVLECQKNKLQQLDLSKNNILETVNVADNKLTSFSLGNQSLLKNFDCSNNNELSQLDLTGCPALEELSFHDCNLSNLDLSQNNNLSWVFAYNNGIAGKKMTQFIANMPEGHYSQIFIVDTFADSESNICTMNDVREFNKKSWVTMDYIGGGGGEQQLGKFYPGCDYVPTVSENKISFTTTRSAGEKITLYLSSSASMIIDGVKETAATGKNTYTLTGSTITISGDVTELECPDNDITSLTFSDPSLLTRLECQNNHITKLDLSGAGALTQLYAENNNISSLNLTGCNALVRVNCYQNNLHGAKMTAFVNSLSKSTAEPLLFVIDTKSSKEHNVATTTQVAIAKDKGWIVYDYSGGSNWEMGEEYAGSEPTGDELPDEFFTFTRNSLGELSFNVTFADESANVAANFPTVEGATIIGWSGKGLMLKMTEETVTVYGDIEIIELLFCDIEDIDVTNLPNLKKLNVALNDISTIDLTQNSKLQMFSCECNLLEDLDFSGNPELSFVNCYGNKIKGAAMTAMMTSLPQRDKNNSGTLIVRDVTYTQNANVCLKSDVSIGLKKYWVTCEVDDENNLIPYDGEDPAGIEDITTDSNCISYDATTGVISLAQAGNIYVFNPAGIIVAKAEGATELSTKDLPAGVYIVRSDDKALKIAK